MTEDEAKTKWCPFGPTHHKPAGDVPGAQEVDDLKSRAHCIGRACMAWRWRVSPEAAAYDNERTSGGARSVASGYCGLAGRP